MKKAVMWTLGLFMITGLAIGPGYWAYGKYLSGDKVGEFPLMEREVDHTSVAGISSTSAKEAEYFPVEVELTPAMNPVALIVSSRAVPPSTSANRTKHAAFRMTAISGGEQVWREDFGISYTRKKEEKDTIKIGALGKAQFPHITKRLDLFRVPEAGTYTFEAETAPRDGDALDHLIVSEMDLTIRRNVQPADTRVVFAGFGLFLVAFAGLWTLKDRLQGEAPHPGHPS